MSDALQLSCCDPKDGKMTAIVAGHWEHPYTNVMEAVVSYEQAFAAAEETFELQENNKYPSPWSIQGQTAVCYCMCSTV